MYMFIFTPARLDKLEKGLDKANKYSNITLDNNDNNTGGYY